MTRATYTTAIMEVPADLFEIVRGKLLAAGYDHAVDDRDGTLDLHGISFMTEKPDDERKRGAPSGTGGDADKS
jgi:hypothetical protein